MKGKQHAKKVMSDSLGLVNSVLNLPDGQVIFLGGNSNYRTTVINHAHQIFGGLVHAGYSLPKWQAVKLTFFAPWERKQGKKEESNMSHSAPGSNSFGFICEKKIPWQAK